MKNILDVFGRDEQFATVLMVAFTDFYGGYPLFGDPDDDEPNKRSWSPHTIALEIAQDSGGLRPENLDKLMAAAEISTTNHFSDNVSDFIRLCNILSDSPTDGTFDPAEPREIVWGIFESLIINGGLEPLSNEIKGYITAAINEYGLSEVPPFLRYVVPELADKFNTTITTDPAMFDLAKGAAEGAQSDIDEFCHARLVQLVSELDNLPLKTKGTRSWLFALNEVLQGALNASQDSSS